MRKIQKVWAATAGASLILGLAFNSYVRIEWGKAEAAAEEISISGSPAFEYLFSGTGTLKESASSDSSASGEWWLRSGGFLKNQNGTGRTNVGDLPTNDPLRIAYAEKTPVASDNGYHPQNIFRLLSRANWQDAEQILYVKVLDENLFHKENSHAWNAVSLISRHYDENNYYYASIRMDGTATIKKKRNGEYSTLASKKILSGKYDSKKNPNLIPKNKKIGLKTSVFTRSDGSVELKLYVDMAGNGSWQLVTQAVDAGKVGGTALPEAGRTGIYTDYMDVEFSNYKLYAAKAAPVPAPATAPVPEDDKSLVGSGEIDDTPAPALDTSVGLTPKPEPAPAPSGSIYGLSSNTTIAEAGSMNASTNPNWWVNSGAYFTVQNGIGRTVQGKLPESDYWRKLYANNNPVDTDNGYNPQNIFRLITKSTFEDYVQQGYFKLNKYNASASPNRDGHNGILFFNRYKNGDNLYYTGIRVDGKAVIKKKVGGTYYTLKMNTVYPGSYNRSSNPNLIPTGKWIGLRSEVKDNSDGSVSIKVYVDKDGNGNWSLAAEATDNGSQGAKVTGRQYVGIRTDFADVDVKYYSIKEI